jgi:hypothetical protein
MTIFCPRLVSAMVRNGTFTLTHNITEKQEMEMEEGDKKREEFVKECIENQIATWTVQRINDRNTIEVPSNEHVKIIYDLINDITARLMDIHTMKTKDSDSNPDPDPSLNDIVKEMRERREADLKQGEEAELKQKKKPKSRREK